MRNVFGVLLLGNIGHLLACLCKLMMNYPTVHLSRRHVYKFVKSRQK